MQFDWTTFALEVLNFLVLLWILTRFLYRPVLGVIDARRDAMRKQEESVLDRQRDADALKARYDALVRDWDRQREQARQQLQQELAAQKSTGLDAIRRDLDGERERSAARTAVAASMRESELVLRATETAYRHVSSMLERLAGPELTARLVDVLLEDLRDLPEPDRQKLAGMAMPAVAAIVSAHALDDVARRRLAEALAGVAGGAPAPTFTVQPELIAGIRVTFGQWTLKANLADELSWFMERDVHA